MGDPVQIIELGSDLVIRMLDKDVAAAGVAEQLVSVNTPLPAGQVLIQAKQTNTGIIYVGGENVLNDASQGVALERLDAVVWDSNKLDKIWVNATVNGEGVTMTYWG